MSETISRSREQRYGWKARVAAGAAGLACLVTGVGIGDSLNRPSRGEQSMAALVDLTAMNGLEHQEQPLIAASENGIDIRDYNKIAESKGIEEAFGNLDDYLGEDDRKPADRMAAACMAYWTHGGWNDALTADQARLFMARSYAGSYGDSGIDELAQQATRDCLNGIVRDNTGEK